MTEEEFEAVFGREVEDAEWAALARKMAKDLDAKMMQPIAEKQKDGFYCPGCGEDWAHGWEERTKTTYRLDKSKLKEFLATRKKIRCAKCEKTFDTASLQSC